MNILITGAAGYIAHHCILKLRGSGHSIFGLDLVESKNPLLFRNFYVGDHGNIAFVQSIFKAERIECIIHASGSSNVRKTIKNPLEYYCNDLMGTIFFLKTAIEENIKKLIFLSSTQVYGNITQFSATENTSPIPINPLGKIKLAIEQFIESLVFSYDLHAIVLRITNIIGMDTKAVTFPQNKDLLSNLLLNDKVDIFGDNSSFEDHSFKRDFIHVNDVAQAIILSLSKLGYWKKYAVYNISSGCTHSVKDIIKIVENITYQNINIKFQKRQSGEIEQLVIDSYLARKELDWHLQYPSLEYMIESTNDWLKSHGKP